MKKLGNGYYGTVYRFKDDIAVKVTKNKTTLNEYKILKILKGFGVPDVYSHKTYNDGTRKLFFEFIPGLTLYTWLKTKPSLDEKKSIVFQVIHNLYRIHRAFPKFRHNDCHLKNIIVKRVPLENKVIRLKHVTFTVSNMGVEPIIVDFGHALFPGIKSCMEGGHDFKLFDIHRDSHKMYDVQIFLYSLQSVEPEIANLFTCDSKYVRLGRLRKNVSGVKLKNFNTILTDHFFTSLRHPWQPGPSHPR